MDLKVGDEVERIWGDGYMRNKMRVSALDDKFIYCDQMYHPQNPLAGEDGWIVLSPEMDPWKFDIVYGVETDEEQGWGIEPYGRNIVLTRIVLPD